MAGSHQKKALSRRPVDDKPAVAGPDPAAEARFRKHSGVESWALARQTGDLFGQRNAINSLTFNAADITARLRMEPGHER